VRITGVKGQAARDAGLSPGMVILQVGRTRSAAWSAEPGAVQLQEGRRGDAAGAHGHGNSAFVAVKAGQ
jgi:serine protease Do